MAVPELRERIEELDLEPAVRHARRSWWAAIRALGAGLAALPDVLARALRSLATTVERASEGGGELAERTRRAASAARAAPGELRRSRRRRWLALTGAFTVGLGLGWWLARRAAGPVDEFWTTPPAAAPGVPPSPSGSPSGAPVADRDLASGDGPPDAAGAGTTA